MNAILNRYSHLAGNQALVFDSITALLSENSDRLNWASFHREDWALFQKIAVSEGVAGMIHHQLKTEPEVYCSSEFDSATYQHCAHQEALTAITNAVYFNHLNQVLAALSEHKIATVLLKGAHLAKSIYPHPALRPMSDLDILVREQDFDRALHLVNELGYHQYLPEVLPNFNQHLSHHAHLKKSGDIGVILELHWILVASPAFRHAASMDWFWENIEPNLAWKSTNPSTPQGFIFNLNPTANLLYLTAHQILQHGAGQTSLRWLLDLHRLVQQKGDAIDWQALAAQAAIFRWESALKEGLQLVRLTFSTPVPGGFLESLAVESGDFDRLVKSKSKQSSSRILSEGKIIRSLKWPGRIRLVLALVFPGPAYMRWRYRPKPIWIWPLLYFYRWFDIAGEAFRTIFVKMQNR